MRKTLSILARAAGVKKKRIDEGREACACQIGHARKKRKGLLGGWENKEWVCACALRLDRIADLLKQIVRIDERTTRKEKENRVVGVCCLLLPFEGWNQGGEGRFVAACRRVRRMVCGGKVWRVFVYPQNQIEFKKHKHSRYKWHGPLPQTMSIPNSPILLFFSLHHCVVVVGPYGLVRSVWFVGVAVCC